MKRSIPLSEGFEICFCLRVSEREKRREGEEKAQTETQTDRGSVKSVGNDLLSTAAQSEKASQKRKKQNTSSSLTTPKKRKTFFSLPAHGNTCKLKYDIIVAKIQID